MVLNIDGHLPSQQSLIELALNKTPADTAIAEYIFISTDIMGGNITTVRKPTWAFCVYKCLLLNSGDSFQSTAFRRFES